jgi:tetratricopeptide (TPR) repeat protein
LILALLLQVGPNPLSGGLPGDDLVRDRPPRPEAATEELNPSSAWLERCFDQIEQDPARAHSLAQIRRAETTGTDRVLANHCLGIAASELGLWDDARAAFVAAREETPADEPRTRARFAALAGNAALAGGDSDGALALLSQAEADAQTAADATLGALAAIDRARALVALGRSDAALGALDAATILAPKRAEGWLLKATLLRRLERLDAAQTAIATAATLAPTDPEIGLEAGVIAVLAGRDAAARQSWESVIALGPGPAADTAAGYLAQLGVASETVPAPAPASVPPAQPPEETPR